MTNAVLVQAEAAAAPEAIAAIKAVEAFIASMGVDPTKWVVNYLPAKLVLVGTLLAQVPALESAEAGVIATAIDGVLSSWVASLSKVAA